jgi:hypothetical protein
MLYGRREERARIAAPAEGCPQGRAGVLVVRGEAGIGKQSCGKGLCCGATPSLTCRPWARLVGLLEKVDIGAAVEMQSDEQRMFLRY